MWCVVGLGNPGRTYAATRHNAGFMAVDALAERLGAGFRDKDTHRIAEGSIGRNKVLLVEPLTYMNLSGAVVGPIARRNGIPPEHVIVIHDELDLPLAALRLKAGGGAGGHKGIISVAEHLGAKDFIRVRIGIGRDPAKPAEQYVLEKFKPGERGPVGEAVLAACDAVEAIILEGIAAAMNKFNQKGGGEKE